AISAGDWRPCSRNVTSMGMLGSWVASRRTERSRGLHGFLGSGDGKDFARSQALKEPPAELIGPKQNDRLARLERQGNLGRRARTSIAEGDDDVAGEHVEVVTSVVHLGDDGDVYAGSNRGRGGRQDANRETVGDGLGAAIDLTHDAGI